MKDVVIIGGGLAGLTSAILLARKNLDVLLIEKKDYPLHKVCGEYVSKEVVPFLQSIDAYPTPYSPADITQFRLSAISGKEVTMPLDLGGFGISRYNFDHFLYKRALSVGASFLLRTTVLDVQKEKEGFNVPLRNGEEIKAKVVLGSWGKRSEVDRVLNRDFFQQRSSYIGVKYHIKADLPHNEVALHNFPDGYCGVCKIDEDKWNVCYLGSRKSLRKWGSIDEMEKNDLAQNPHVNEIFANAEFISRKPLVINEINFDAKQAVENGILMIGDAAGLITPLCGNGMALAIHSGKLAAETIIKHYHKPHFNRARIEEEYKNAWQDLFARRLWLGRQTQSLFGNPFLSLLTVGLVQHIKPLARTLIRHTHGQPF